MRVGCEEGVFQKQPWWRKEERNITLVRLGQIPSQGEMLEERENLKMPKGEGIFEKDRSFLEEVAQRVRCNLERKQPCVGKGVK